MTIAQELDDQKGICQDVIFPPGDLYSDEPPLESELHLRQIILLLTCLEWLWRDRNDFYAAGNLTIYYSPRQRKSEYFRGPDFFVVLGTERKTRKSWVVWEEDGKYPNVILEILSDSTANTDKGLKKEIYQNTFRTLDYFWFDPYTQEFAGFHLVDGEYQPLQASEQGYLWSQQLGLYLGAYQGLLRFFTRDGQLVPTPEETAEQAEQKAGQAEQKAGQAEQKAEQAEQKAERLAAKLRELNIDPDTI
ncbi:Uma2 family endonuclease [Nostoc sp. XA010]|uniref:Uma2 family endonuclease n=1 Tax=Nostoc sp. XA010 TaxID=2780407 RepID=UPI001E28C1ED|nr:Uma2 family endonuclease [Nostoc sp. XA010]MCC5657005.1 Uma2 family endonuclease [Nostoc sp. XA010]